jgi:hypothetical protein
MRPGCAQEAPTENEPNTPAPLVVFNREIFVCRAPLANLTPTQRRDTTLKRMRAVSDILLYQSVQAIPTSIGGLSGTSFMIGEDHLFSILESDLDPAAGETLTEVTKELLEKLEEVRKAKKEQRNPSVIFRGIGVILVATIILAALLWILRWLGKKLRRFVVQKTSKLKQPKVRNFDFRPVMLVAFRMVLAMIGWIIGIVAAYIWVGTVLAQFPFTAPWGHLLADQVHGLFSNALQSVIGALPGIAVVLIIFAVTRWAARLANHLFRQFEERRDSDSDS